MAPLVNTSPFRGSALPTGDLTSQISGGNSCRLYLAASEKVLMCTNTGFPDYVTLRFLNTASDSLGATVDTDTAGGDNNQSTGNFIPLASGVVGHLTNTAGAIMEVAPLDVSGSVPSYNANYSLIIDTASEFVANHAAISNGDDKIWFTTAYVTGGNGYMRYYIVDYDDTGPSFSLDEQGQYNFDAGPGGNTSEVSVGLVDAATESGLMAWTESPSASNVSSFDFNGTLSNRVDSSLGLAPNMTNAQQRRMVIFGTTKATVLMKNNTSTMLMANITNITGTPSVGTFVTARSGSLFSGNYGLAELDSTRVMFWWVEFSGATDRIKYKICDISGANPSIGSEQVLLIGSAPQVQDTLKLADGRTLFAYTDGGALKFHIFEG